jgi:hypothetical protein
MLEASGIRYGGQGLYTIPGLVNADPDGKSPYGCFLTQVGGALNGGFFGQFGVSIMITHPQVIGGWIWRVSVDQPGLGTSAGFGCLQ